MSTIRTASSADIEAVLGFWEHATTEPSSTDDVGSLDLLLATSPEALLLALDEDVIIGTVIVGWDGWRGAMYRLAVARSHRRRGVATALVDEGERRLHAHGAKRLHLIVADHEIPARDFWTSAGYEPTAQLRFVKILD